MKTPRATLSAMTVDIARAEALLSLAARRRADGDLAGAQSLELAAQGLLLPKAECPPLKLPEAASMLLAVYDAAVADPARVWRPAAEQRTAPPLGWVAADYAPRGYVAVMPSWAKDHLFNLGASPAKTVEEWKAAGWIASDANGISSKSTMGWTGRCRMLRFRLSAIDALRNM